MKNEEIVKIIEKMNEKNKKMVLKMLNSSERDYIDSKMSFSTQETKENDLIGDIYKKDIEKLFYILNNKELLKKIGGLKVLVSGDTGTGKTTLIKKVIKSLPNYEEHHFIAEELISPKMGQTQLNILKLSRQLTGKNKILFIDEVDSIISNRFNNSDLTEYHRITSSFIKMLDELSPATIVFFSTNLASKIDPAILRRMNFKLEGKKLSPLFMLENIVNDTKINLTAQKKNMLLEALSGNAFSISDLNYIVNELNIAIAMDEAKEPYAFILSMLQKLKFKIDLSFIKSERAKNDLKKWGVSLNEI